MKLARFLFLVVLLAAGCGRPAAPHRMTATQGSTVTQTLTLTGTTATPGVWTSDQSATLSYFVVSTGTASGTWGIDCSADNSTWTAYTLDSTPPAAAGSPQTFGVAVTSFEYPFGRLTFTYSGGTGSATVYTQIKAN